MQFGNVELAQLPAIAPRLTLAPRSTLGLASQAIACHCSATKYNEWFSVAVATVLIDCDASPRMQCTTQHGVAGDGMRC